MYRPKGLKEASAILSVSYDFLLYYDPDIDGAVSGELVRRLLVSGNKPFAYYINENRTHGFRLSDRQISLLAGKTLILVDAAMTRAEIEMLTARGVNVINIDHHNIDEVELVSHRDPVTSAQGIIINNQYPFEPEEYRFLSGAGMVYYTLEGMFPGFLGPEGKALVGLSLLSDIRPIESDLARDFLHTTYTAKTPLTAYFVDLVKEDYDFGFGVQTFDRNFIDFTFSPRVNSLFRLNKGDQAIQLFQGNFENGKDLKIYRNVQNSVRDTIIDHMQVTEFSNLFFSFVDLETIPNNYGYDFTNFIGLACSKLKNDGKTTLLFAKQGGAIKRGSVRGLADDVNYLDIFRRHGFDAEGHQNAFGVKGVNFDTLDLQALNQELAEKEAGYNQRKYLGRILEVNSLSFFSNSENSQIADHNNYVRDARRVYLRYTGSNITRQEKGRAVLYQVDGYKVLSFEPDLDFNNGLILPVKERGSYINFYLKRY